MLNTVVIMGRLTAKPELKTTNSGTNVTIFSVAVDRYAKPGEAKTADFFRVTAWKNTAKFVSDWFDKGDQIAIRGRLQTRSWTDYAGQKKTVTEIVADEVSFCGSKKSLVATPDSEATKEEAPKTDVYADDDDLPF